jgi:hypothetical protein
LCLFTGLDALCYLLEVVQLGNVSLSWVVGWRCRKCEVLGLALAFESLPLPVPTFKTSVMLPSNAAMSQNAYTQLVIPKSLCRRKTRLFQEAFPALTAIKLLASPSDSLSCPATMAPWKTSRPLVPLPLAHLQAYPLTPKEITLPYLRPITINMEAKPDTPKAL